MLLLWVALCCCDDEALVARWFEHQRAEWFYVAERCTHLAVLFSDERWLGMTETLARELLSSRGTCVALWLWLDSNSSAVERCEQRTVPCFVDRRAGDSARWGTRAYFNKIAHRLPVMAAVADRLALDPHRGLALIDSDVALLRRATLERFAQHVNATLVIQQEWPCSTAPHRLCVNGGVWWLRRTADGRRLLRRAVALMRQLAVPDQDALDVVARTVAVHYLDRRRYANGHTAQHDRSWRARDAHLVHANWLQGIESKSALLTRARALSHRIY